MANVPPSNGWISVGGGSNDPPPTILWVNDEELIVEGAGVSEINGTYRRRGKHHDVVPKYVKRVKYYPGRNAKFTIHCEEKSDSMGQQWCISKYTSLGFLPLVAQKIDFYATEDTTLCLFEDAAAAAAASKLRRLSISSPTDKEMKIVDLPEWAIREIIDYIPKTSRALLALALTTDSASWREIHWNKSAPKSILSWFKCDSRGKMKRPSAVTKIILSPKNADEEDLWEEINFEDNCFYLCIKLTDDDIAGMLACIDSVQQLKSLYLTNCDNITGRALEPLRGSNILERLDLSLCPNHGQYFWGIPSLSQIRVLPILYSMIGRENHSLRHLQFPRMWRNDGDSGYFERFLQQYNETEHQRNIFCQNCSVDCKESLSLLKDDSIYLGVQNFTCYDCLNHYCYNCKDGGNRFYLTFCALCEKWRCRDCQMMQPCRSCNDTIELEFHHDYLLRNEVAFICNDCTDGDSKCRSCGDVFCPDCQEEIVWCSVCDEQGCDGCMEMWYCEHENCGERQCVSCRDSQHDENEHDENCVSHCPACLNTFCFKHRLEDCEEDWENCCRECLRMIAPMLAHGYKTAQRQNE